MRIKTDLSWKDIAEFENGLKSILDPENRMLLSIHMGEKLSDCQTRARMLPRLNTYLKFLLDVFEELEWN